MIYARKVLGQHFLKDPLLLNKIASFCDYSQGLVMEIGPGQGALTEAILKKNPKKLLLIEKDDRLKDELISLLAKYKGTASQLIIDDVLDAGFQNILERMKGIASADQEDGESVAEQKTVSVIGNLPYNIASHIMRLAWRQRHLIKDMVFTIQQEVANRIIAPYSTKTYGRLSVFMQQAFICKKVMNIKAGAFFPKPRVTSSVVVFKAIDDKSVSFNDEDFEAVVNSAFQMRRKQLKSSLANVSTDPVKLCELSEVKPDLRAEALLPQDFIRLANKLPMFRK